MKQSMVFIHKTKNFHLFSNIDDEIENMNKSIKVLIVKLLSSSKKIVSIIKGFKIEA